MSERLLDLVDEELEALHRSRTTVREAMLRICVAAYTMGWNDRRRIRFLAKLWEARQGRKK